MKLRYTEFCLNPALRNTTTHLPQHRAQALIDSGAAVEVPMPPRGSSGWLAEMREREEQRIALIPADQRQITQFPQPSWSVRHLKEQNKYVVVFNHLTTETIYGERVLLDGKGRPDLKGTEKQLVSVLTREGCPKAVIQKYLDAKNAPDFLAAEAARIDADRRAAEAQRERERYAPRFI